MSESDEIELWCWVLGDPYERVFSVTIKRSASIQDLKKAIKGEKQSFTGVDADSIDLYKFQLPLKDFKDHAQSIDLANGEKLKSFEEVLFYWVEAPGEVLSMILPRPAGKGFAKLQSLLDAQHPEHNFDDYVSSDVLATKAAFLRDQKAELETKVVDDGLVLQLELSCQPPSADVVVEDRIVGDGDVVDDDVDNTHEAMAIFPYTFQYMDLTDLQLKEVLCVPKLMLFRNDYVTMIDIFNKREKGTKGSAVFSGQPGIGKTCMLYYILILCIILGRPIVFQDIFGKVFVIGTTVLPLGTPGISIDAEDVLALVDADNVACQPDDYLLNHKQYRILLTSPPKPQNHRKWLHQIVGPRATSMMDLWSREELVVASLLLEREDITPKRLQEASRICGNIPRECFSAAVSPDALQDAEKTIKGAIKNSNNLSDAFRRVSVGGETVIHRIFQIRPSSERRLWIDCFVEPVSDWSFLELLDELYQ
ncbi:uncharacterized protein LACBIDRAFT_326431 [Laccaria bicolor S238N-H82]|uniref:Predicted protein n=1 Tax=Laccaria bicolor (strain S238N-H82 / ATCC MYA-4686) TaxID=486041 RepID=B0D8J3_LACBS|nr:uncharacterized protein LACBIDRAFT_326431 [Laccaria bicolor S238N-H82]EDR08850.1 predicted protein [Laccaria bicolor S238N-H82]|eukprot:XP_001880163.1 predicted protein [Laccaria bicolor S238N-H82]